MTRFVLLPAVLAQDNRLMLEDSDRMLREVCADKAGWQNEDYGWDCKLFKYSDFCKDGRQGDEWSESIYGPFVDTGALENCRLSCGVCKENTTTNTSTTTEGSGCNTPPGLRKGVNNKLKQNDGYVVLVKKNKQKRLLCDDGYKTSQEIDNFIKANISTTEQNLGCSNGKFYAVAYTEGDPKGADIQEIKNPICVEEENKTTTTTTTTTTEGSGCNTPPGLRKGVNNKLKQNDGHVVLVKKNKEKMLLCDNGYKTSQEIDNFIKTNIKDTTVHQALGCRNGKFYAVAMTEGPQRESIMQEIVNPICVKEESTTSGCNTPPGLRKGVNNKLKQNDGHVVLVKKNKEKRLLCDNGYKTSQEIDNFIKTNINDTTVHQALGCRNGKFYAVAMNEGPKRKSIMQEIMNPICVKEVSTPTQVCEDDRPNGQEWRNINGHTCAVHAVEKWCFDGQLSKIDHSYYSKWVTWDYLGNPLKHCRLSCGVCQN